MSREKLNPWTKREFNRRKFIYEKAGYKVTNRWRKGVKSIKLEPIVLGYR